MRTHALPALGHRTHTPGPAPAVCTRAARVRAGGRVLGLAAAARMGWCPRRVATVQPPRLPRGRAAPATLTPSCTGPRLTLVRSVVPGGAPGSRASSAGGLRLHPLARGPSPPRPSKGPSPHLADPLASPHTRSGPCLGGDGGEGARRPCSRASYSSSRRHCAAPAAAQCAFPREGRHTPASFQLPPCKGSYFKPTKAKADFFGAVVRRPWVRAVPEH